MTYPRMFVHQQQHVNYEEARQSDDVIFGGAFGGLPRRNDQGNDAFAQHDNDLEGHRIAEETVI